MIYNLEIAIREAFEKAEREGWSKGMKEGMKEGEANMLRSMFARGMTVGQLAELTGMPVDKIECVVNPE